MNAHCKCVVFVRIKQADVDWQAQPDNDTKIYCEFHFIQCKLDICKFYINVNGTFKFFAIDYQYKRSSIRSIHMYWHQSTTYFPSGFEHSCFNNKSGMILETIKDSIKLIIN